MKAPFLRIQVPGVWNPKHKSKHPKNFRPKTYYTHGEGEWETLPGMACRPLTPRWFTRATLGLPVLVATKEEWPLLMPWEEEGIEELWDYDLYHHYYIVIFWGRKVGDLPDGVVAVPEPLDEDALRNWLKQGIEEIKQDKEIMKIMRAWGADTDEKIVEEILSGEWQDEETGLLMSYKKVGDRYKELKS